MTNNKKLNKIVCLGNKFFTFIFPQYCVLCGSKCQNDRENISLCAACQSNLPIIKTACIKCGQELLQTKTDNKQLICGHCLADVTPISRMIVPFKYQYPIDHFVGKLKFRRKLLYARLLGTLLSKHLKKHYLHHSKPQVIIPVPLHRKRLRKRGFNQALEIARVVAKNLDIPIDKYSCKRLKDTQPQTLLPIRERKQNVSRAFAVKNHLSYKYVAIIDDVTTTGDTITEFCKLLLKNGAAKIDVWCCAKTHLH